MEVLVLGVGERAGWRPARLCRLRKERGGGVGRRRKLVGAAGGYQIW